MKVYVAGSFLEKDKVRQVEDALRFAGHKIVSAWVDHTDSPSLHELSDEAFSDFADVYRCEAMVIVYPGRYGTHAELGAAIALGKKVIILGEVDPYRCVYYNHPCVLRTQDVGGVLNLLTTSRELYNI